MGVYTTITHLAGLSKCLHECMCVCACEEELRPSEKMYYTQFIATVSYPKRLLLLCISNSEILLRFKCILKEQEQTMYL